MGYNESYIGLRPDLLKHIKGHLIDILDVGCALGSNGQYLINNNFANSVYGIEFDEKMATEAKKNITKVFCGNLNDDSFRKEVRDKSPLFDYILFGDILEHLYDPLKVLKDLKSLLKPDGTIIISLPNVGHVELFIQVYIKGTWPLNERGIFDRTHIRWFTRKDVYKLAKSANLQIINYERNLRARDAIGSKFDWKAKILKYINKDLVTFQHILVCKHG